MKVLFTVLVTFFAGMGAGLGTGFAGMSAAAVISPMLITFLHMDPYMAVGIALSSDVLASAVSAYTYHKNKNLDIKNGLIMMVSVLAFTVVGSWVASKVPSATMGGFSVFMTFLLGVKFIVRPVMTTKEAMEGVSPQKRAVQSVVCGVLIGFICGFIGAGGGMMMLLILTSAQAYNAVCKPLCQELKLPQTAFDILMFLANNPDRRTASDIVEFRHIKANLVSMNVDRLVKEGYLERRAVAGDRRKTELLCTEKARPVIERGRAVQNAFFARLLTNTDEPTREAFFRTMEIIGKNLDDILKENA